MRRAQWLIAAAALVTFAFAAGVFPASPALGRQPTATYISVSDGDVFSEPVVFIQLCFAEPIDTTDLALGGDFRFELLSPSISLGMRVALQPNGYGVALYPGFAPGDTNGDWTFNYRVTSPDTREALEGTVKYRVDPAGQPVQKAPPSDCLVGGATQPPKPDKTAIPTARPTGTTSPSAPDSASPGPTASPNDVSDTDGDGPDILLLALLTVGTAAGAGLIAIVGYLIRRRIGYEPHAPPEGEPPPDHH